MKEILYPNLKAEMARKGISYKAISESAGISMRTFNNRLRGEQEFTWPEVLAIHETFFADLDLKYLFQKKD